MANKKNSKKNAAAAPQSTLVDGLPVIQTRTEEPAAEPQTAVGFTPDNTDPIAFPTVPAAELPLVVEIAILPEHNYTAAYLEEGNTTPCSFGVHIIDVQTAILARLTFADGHMLETTLRPEEATINGYFDDNDAVLIVLADITGVPAPTLEDTGAAAPTLEPPAPETKERVFHLRLNETQLAALQLAVQKFSPLASRAGFAASCIDDKAFGAETAQGETVDNLTRAHNLLVESLVNVDPPALELTETLTAIDALIERAKKAPAGNGNGTGHKIFDKYSPIAILNWMGANGFNQYDAKNALQHFGVDTDEIAKTTWSRALAKGKKPGENKVKIITDLTAEQEVELMQFYNLAAREAATAANEKIAAAQARLDAKNANGGAPAPAVQ